MGLIGHCWWNMLWISKYVGIGFKSVFLVTKKPYTFNNGYKIRFNEIPPPGSRIGYIVPEWIDEEPRIEDLQENATI